MKIVSWNIKHSHKTPIKKIKELFDEEPADIYCFQELNEKVLKFLKEQHQFQLHYDKEFSKIDSKTKEETCSYLVILSKEVIQNTGNIHIAEPDKPISKISTKLQKYSSMFENYTAENAIYIDIKRLSDHKQFRIFNTHLKRFTTPKNRIHQFQKAISVMDHTKENIFCGDFNILDTFLGKLSGTFFNSTLKNNFKYDERKEFNNILEIHKLVNPFKNKITFDYKYLPGLQLDHIIVPEHTNISDLEILDIKKFESDHAPIMLEIE
jgi:endonuclease/exonuclease/phosphatase family metal-dependent hydrolase